MGNIGRIFCVALPFVLTVLSIIFMLVGGLAGVSSNNLYMFQVNMTDLSVSASSVTSLMELAGRSAGNVDVKARSMDNVPWHDRRLLADVKDTTTSKQTISGSTASNAASALSSNVTAADLGLADMYDITLWGYCSTSQSGKKTCTKAKFDWASTYLNTSSLSNLGSSAGVNITLPDSITTALSSFKTVVKWTEVVYIIAVIALGFELLFGFFTSCSRGISCLTWVVAGIASLAVCGACAMMTATAAVVIGAVEGSAKWYGVTASFNTSFLAVIWIGAAFALAAGGFWFFTICCCKPERRARASNKRHMDESEKMLPTGAYTPLHDPHQPYAAQPYAAQPYGAQPSYGNNTYARSDLAYEPYSHSRV